MYDGEAGCLPAFSLHRGSQAPKSQVCTNHQAQTSTQANFKCKDNKFCSSICAEEEKNTLPGQAGVVSDTATGYRALLLLSSGIES